MNKYIHYTKILTLEEFNRKMKEGFHHFERYVFKNIDFTKANEDLAITSFTDCVFLECVMDDKMPSQFVNNCLVLPVMNVPFDLYRKELYNAESLYDGYICGNSPTLSDCYDQKVYSHFIYTGKHASDPTISLARTLHDYSISNAVNEFMKNYDEKQVVAIMGGHGLSRSDDMFRNIAILSKILTENNYLMISGGGPGAMEATHFGAWMAGRTEKELDNALDILRTAPTFTDDKWIETAFYIMQDYPQTYNFKSLSIPTWLYGHEPSTPFATHIAKYFENSIREDALLTLAYGGIIYSPGSAGTLQEIFQEAVQDHYLSFGYASPMIFLGKHFWTEEMPIYPLLEKLVQLGKYKNLLLSITDNYDEILDTITNFRNDTNTK
ncbi:MAG: hypothetical protein KBT33_12650 [Prevotellaceae bacterium]|nr:hypothetical protein [Candidatus Minthosoma equi]